ncbi:S1C family serine protease [Carnimonas nigrificans]|uniref:S1C family serine protease n=1 Tax=Carnimonas nigrificans TaxID=64323 RepID=UPI00046EB8F4|nr:trypsin-like peptidase domain-containing protein [Carnimonas nigrificans]
MSKTLAKLIWPVICGVLLAIVLLAYLPGLSSYRGTHGALSSSPASYADSVERAAPAVVMISSQQQVNAAGGSPLGDNPLYQQNQASNTPNQPVNLGSGVIVSDDGYLLTNNHVVKEADDIVVTLPDGRVANATAIGSDPDTDLAVLKINLPDLPIIDFANSDTIRTGDVALAIGNPFNIGQSVTMGIVSAVGRASLGLSAYESFIQTDASINPGNSGGALINSNGKLIGINTAIFSTKGSSQGIGFAIPTNVARRVLRDIIAHGHVVRGWLGIEAQLRAPPAEVEDLKTNDNLIITKVTPGGPAAEAGVRENDYILALDGAPMLNPSRALRDIAGLRPDSTVTLTLLRDGKVVMTPIKVGSRPENIAPVFNASESSQSSSP